MAFKNGILPRGFKSEAERLSVRFREELRLSIYDPLDAFLLADHLAVDVVPVSQLPMTRDNIDVLHGIGLKKVQWFAITLITEDGLPRIVHNDKVAPTRQQSDIMHELAHVIRKHESCGDTYTNGLPFPLRKYDPVHEAEAECLGATLQLPKPALLWRTKLNESPEQIGIYYNASPAMVRRRLGESGVSRIRKYGSINS